MSIGFPKKDKPLSSPPSLSNAGVLVVDEDPAFQLGLKTFLREYVGFENVFTASSGEDALELIEKEEKIKVITLDYRMPGMSGIDVLEQLSQSAPRPLTVLMITGYPSDELEKRYRSYNSSNLIATQFISKPIEFEKLEPIIIESYQELKAAQRLTKTLTGEVQDETAPIRPQSMVIAPGNTDQFQALEEKLNLANAKIEELKCRLPTIQEKFWLGVLKIVAIITILWIASQLGWIDKAKEFLNRGEAAAIEQPVPPPSIVPDEETEKVHEPLPLLKPEPRPLPPKPADDPPAVESQFFVEPETENDSAQQADGTPL